jgi:predicted pyridoxine 5'-phosphate oxidase superfamily flavin-nucleotide-binding protein
MPFIFISFIGNSSCHRQWRMLQEFDQQENHRFGVPRHRRTPKLSGPDKSRCWTFGFPANLQKLRIASTLKVGLATSRTPPHCWSRIHMGILSDDMKRLVREQRLGYIATVCPDGTPNLSPKGTTAVWDDDHLVFADIRSPRSVQNIEHNPSVEINVVDPLVRKGYRFKGRGVVHRSDEVFQRGCRMYREAGLTIEIRAVVLIRVERALPLISPA